MEKHYVSSRFAKGLCAMFPQEPPSSSKAKFIVQDDSDGNGPFIARWDIDAPIPSEEEIAAALENK